MNIEFLLGDELWLDYEQERALAEMYEELGLI